MASSISPANQRRSINALKEIENPPLGCLKSLGLEPCREDGEGRHIYQIKGCRDRYQAYLKGGQVKWESSQEATVSDLEAIIRFSIDNNRSLLINAGKKGYTDRDHPQLGDISVLLATARKINERQDVLKIVMHAVSKACPPLTHEDYPKIDIIDAWCFGSKADVKDYVLPDRIRKYAEEVLHVRQVNMRGDNATYIESAGTVTINNYQNEKSSPKQALSLIDFLGKLRSIYNSESHIRYIHSTEKEEDVCDSFINLAILTQKQVKEAEDPRKQQAENSQLINNRDLYYNSFEALYESKENIDLKEIFSPLKNEPACTRIIVEGRAGIGKTTLCKYIANAWLDPKKRDSLLGWGDQFTVVVWIKLRELNSEAQNLYEAIALLYKLETKEALSKGRETSHIPQVALDVEVLLKPLEDTGKVLYLIDGYDEIADQISSYRHLTEALRSKPNWILTTRPHQFTIRSDEKTRQLEILGFTDDNITAYTDRFFEVFKEEPYSLPGKQAFTKLLATQPNVRCLARIPVNLEILCSMFLDEEIATSPLQTLTSLYEGMLLDILRRYVRGKAKKTPSGFFEGVIAQLKFKEKEILYLEELAFKAMEAKSLIFRPIKTLPEGVSSDDEAAFLQEVFNLGFTKRTKENPNKLKEEHYFFHLTVQEFFAARYLARSILANAKEWREFIHKNKFNNRFSIVFRFTAGFLASHPNKLDDFLKAIIEEPNSALRLHEFVLAAYCLDETPVTRYSIVQKQIVDFMDKAIRSAYNDPYTNYYARLSVLDCMHYIYEQGVADFLIELAKQGSGQAISWIGNLEIQRPNAIKALAQALQDTDKNVRGRAADALGEIKPQDPAALQALVQALQDTDKNVRGRVADALGEIKPQDPVALQALVQALQYPDKDVRGRAADALKKIKPQDPTALQALVQALQHLDEDVRKRAADALGEIKPQDPTVLQALVQALQHPAALQALMQALQDPDKDVRRRVAYALKKIEPQDPAVLQALVQVLQDPYEYVRWRAAYALGEIKPQDSAALQALVQVLQDPYEYVRWRAADVLGEIKPQDSAALQALVQALQDPDKDVRRRAADALGEIKPQDSAALQALVQALQDTDKNVRRKAAYALGRIKPQDSAVLPALVQALQDTDKNVRRKAAYALGEIKPQDSAVLPALVQTLQDTDKNVRRKAAYALGEIKPQDSAVLPALVQALQDTDKNVRRKAAYALGEIKSQDSAVLPALVQALQDPDKDVRWRAADALGEIKPQDSAALQALVQVLQHPDKNVRRSAVDALGEIKPQDPAALQALVQALQDPYEYVRWRAADALGEIKPQDPATLQALVQALQDPDKYVRESAVNALGKIKPQDPAVLQALVQALQDTDEDVRGRAADALGEIKHQDSTVLQALVQALQDTDKNVRWRAADVLGKIKPQDPAVLQALVQALQDTDGDVRWKAADALEEIKPQDPAVLQALVQALQHPDQYVRRSAAYALGAIKPQDPASLQAFVQALQDPDEDVHWRAADVLGKIKPQDPAVLQALVQALQHPDEGVRGRAASALGKIKPQDPVVFQTLVQALQDPDKYVRMKAAYALGQIKPQDPLYFGSIIELFSKSSNQPDQKKLIGILLELPIYSSLSKHPAGHEKVFATLIYLQRKLCIIHPSSIEIEEEDILQPAIEVGKESVSRLKQYLEELNSNPEEFFKRFSSNCSLLIR